MKFLIFDAGPIISLTMSGILDVLEKLKKEFRGEFILTPSVHREVVEKPMKIKKYMLEAMLVKSMISRGVFTPSRKYVSDGRLEAETRKILKLANGILRSKQSGEKIKIIHEGEASCLAFSRICGAENVLVVDERTTRVLTEAPQKLQEMIERKVHSPLEMDKALVGKFSGFKFIRSAELLFVAFKKGLIPFGKDRQALGALLYGVKFKGTAISSGEIEEIKSLVS